MNKRERALFKPDDMVISTYGNRWIGKIISLERWYKGKNTTYPIYLVQPIYDTKGNKQPKHIKPRTLAQSWLELYEKSKENTR